MVNVRDFQYIVEIARTGSISKAASALYITQPTLTKFLQRMENEVGTPLFHRVGKRFLPTPAGEVFVDRAASILRISGQLEQELADLVSMHSGNLRLGVTAGRARYAATVLLPLFHRRFPGVRLVMDINHSAQLLKMVYNNELDLALANCDCREETLDYTVVGEDELVLAVPASSPLAGAGEVTEGFRFPVVRPCQWREETFIMPWAGSRSTHLAWEYLRRVGVAPRVAAELKDLRSVMEAVQAGVGVSIFVSIPFHSEVAYLSLGEAEIPRHQAVVATRRGIYHNEAHRELISLIRETYEN